MENKAFLIDTSKLKHVDDVLADDCGVWLSNGTPKPYYRYVDDDFKIIKDKNPQTLPEKYFILNITYFKNKNSQDFRRKISYVTGK